MNEKPIGHYDPFKPAKFLGLQTKLLAWCKAGPTLAHRIIRYSLTWVIGFFFLRILIPGLASLLIVLIGAPLIVILWFIKAVFGWLFK